MKTYQVTFENGQTAIIEAESESAARQCYIDDLDEFSHIVDDSPIRDVSELGVITIVAQAPPARVAPYLPSNYEVVGPLFEGAYTLVQGRDHLGWTAEAYVIPRLASGLIVAEVIPERSAQ